MRSRKNLTDYFPDAPPDALDMLQSLLQFNPDKRMTAEEALMHPYLAKFHNPSEEHSLSYDVVPPVDDDVQLSVAEYRTKLYDVSMSRVDVWELHQHVPATTARNDDFYSLRITQASV